MISIDNITDEIGDAFCFHFSGSTFCVVLSRIVECRMRILVGECVGNCRTLLVFHGDVGSMFSCAILADTTCIAIYPLLVSMNDCFEFIKILEVAISCVKYFTVGEGGSRDVNGVCIGEFALPALVVFCPKS